MQSAFNITAMQTNDMKHGTRSEIIIKDNMYFLQVLKFSFKKIFSYI